VPHQITITLELSTEEVVALITSKASARIKDFKRSQGKTAAPGPGSGRGRVPKVEAVEQYRQRGSTTGLRGRPNTLTTEGMRLVWSLFNQGYSRTEIAQALAPITSRTSVRRVLDQILKNQES
jgi:hypothetical protein